MRHKEFWIALSLGALAGGVAALLYAPATGAQTRKKLKRSIEDAGDMLEDATAQAYIRENIIKNPTVWVSVRRLR